MTQLKTINLLKFYYSRAIRSNIQFLADQVED
jgi:hypothetical protein